MKTAKEMFEEQGFTERSLLPQMKIYINEAGDRRIDFINGVTKLYDHYYFRLDLQLHLAIHQQMKELGWIE